MKYDELNALMIEFDRLRLDADRVIRKLRALGVTDLPGDAPNSPKSSDGSPGNLPGTDGDMVRRKDVIDALDGGRPGTLAAWARDAILALPAVAPKPAPIAGRVAEPTPEPVRFAFDDDAPRAEVEIPEITDEDVTHYLREFKQAPGFGGAPILAGLRAVRARLIERRGAKS